MPSSPNYVRDYKQEYRTKKKRGEVAEDNARKRDRRKALKLGMVKKGQDLNHKKPISKGGKTGDPKNWSAQSPGKNRSFARNKDGSIKSKKGKKK